MWGPKVLVIFASHRAFVRRRWPPSPQPPPPPLPPRRRRRSTPKKRSCGAPSPSVWRRRRRRRRRRPRTSSSSVDAGSCDWSPKLPKTAPSSALRCCRWRPPSFRRWSSVSPRDRRWQSMMFQELTHPDDLPPRCFPSLFSIYDDQVEKNLWKKSSFHWPVVEQKPEMGNDGGQVTAVNAA